MSSGFLIFVVSVLGILTAELFYLAADALVAFVAMLFGASFKSFFRKGLWGLAAVPLIFAYGSLGERNLYKVKEVEIVSGKVPGSFDGYRIVHISDIHLSSFAVRHKSLARAVAKINSLEPDVVLFTGDLITFTPAEMDGLENILAGIKAVDGVYSVLGNHDYCLHHNWGSDSLRLAAVDEIVERERNMGWIPLMNGNVNISRGSSDGLFSDMISVIGVENTSALPQFPSYGDLLKAKAGAEGSFKVLMSHDPTHWRNEVVRDGDIDLMLSGHTHAMQISFLGWSPSSLIFEEYGGLYERTLGKVWTGKSCLSDAPQYLYVNTGLGETGFPARIGVRPEITLITLRSGKM